MFPRKIFENLHTAVAILVFLEQFSGAFFNQSVSPNMMHFVRTFPIMRA